ncbi:GNAT family N-acetyltransferase [Larsenimonas rhizosphaerae]|uniref:GNAT family N-acetyltransferase n=1 Tax=Larsenimonas rhizosphaerae TaxID=2944682 RepID=A0AA41ZHW3_9GAMM|nr:GNAT family N-acetyltransferase [Larsenimonas rhizosphaerae]MCM2131673.1 GNAT family N-acetyltransferase [Larsenimonas rhizosphaerae]MCX2525001.1 GNAT family N-acetyltransferase [Larsenimonas rhizosphaerae]
MILHEDMIQPLTLDALDALVTLDRLSHQGGWSRVQFLRGLGSPDNLLCGMWQDEVLAGVVVLGWQPFDAELELIMVAPDVRRQGIARLLVQTAITRSAALGKERLLLEVRAGNQAAISLYEGMGFVRDGVRPGYYPCAGGQREDAVLMSYPLLTDTTSA